MDTDYGTLRFFILEWLLMTLLVIAIVFTLPGLLLSQGVIALGTVVVIAFLNMMIEPFLSFITIPISMLTLGTLAILVNSFAMGLIAWVSPEFTLGHLGPITVGLMILTLLSIIVGYATHFYRKQMI